MTADQYPYTSGSTILVAVVQNDALNERGIHGGIGRVEPRDVLFASTPRHPEWEGRTLQDLCDLFDLPGEAAAQRVLDAEGACAFVVIEMMDEADVRTVLRHPTTMIGSDGVPADGANPHPRLYGCFPRVLGRYARDEGLLSLGTGNFPAVVGGTRTTACADLNKHDQRDTPSGPCVESWTDPNIVIADSNCPQESSDDPRGLHQETREIWNQIASFWDEYMGAEGNDFQKLLIGPATERLLEVRPGQLVLDVGCGSGSFARRLAGLGARVLATDFSDAFIERARQRTTEHADRFEYRVVDATDEARLVALGEGRFDAAVCTMASWP